MNIQDIFDTISNSPAFHLATVENGQPRVRGMLLYRADADGIVFHTGAMKDLYGQVMTNPKAELCFNDYQNGVQVRVSGELEIVDDNALKDEIASHPSRAFLKPWMESGELGNFYDWLIVMRLRNGVATTWTMESNFSGKSEVIL